MTGNKPPLGRRERLVVKKLVEGRAKAQCGVRHGAAKGEAVKRCCHAEGPMKRGGRSRGFGLCVKQRKLGTHSSFSHFGISDPRVR